MGRRRQVSNTELAERALPLFWTHGFGDSGVAAIATATGVNKFGLYARFGDKGGLFAATLDHYSASVVAPLIAPLEAEDAGAAAIRAYFRAAIDAAEVAGLPGRGCLMTNSLAETGAIDDRATARITAHLDRIERLFVRALGNARADGLLASLADDEALARLLLVGAQGLWIYARTAPDAPALRLAADTLLDSIGLKEEIA